MRLEIAAQTDVGRKKTTNEDCYGVFREDTPGLRLFDEGALLCIADGLGGHVGGEIASKLAVDIVKDMLKQQPPPPPENEEDTEEEDPGLLPVITRYIAIANSSIYRTNQDLVKTGRPMGTTLLAAVVTPKRIHIGNVGDSRCYHFRDGEIINRTEDHSWVDEQVKQGMMSRAEAESDFRRNIVTRSVGTHPEVPVDSYRWHIVRGDMLLLCTDGLVNMVKDADIRAALRRSQSPAEIAQRLVNMANENGGKDNVTVIVANISPNPLQLLSMRAKNLWRRHGARLLWLLITLLFGAICFAGGYILRGCLPE